MSTHNIGFYEDLTKIIFELDLMFMKHYAPNRCLYIKVAKLRTGVGSAKTSYLQNCSVKPDMGRINH